MDNLKFYLTEEANTSTTAVESTTISSYILTLIIAIFLVLLTFLRAIIPLFYGQGLKVQILYFLNKKHINKKGLKLDSNFLVFAKSTVSNLFISAIVSLITLIIFLVLLFAFDILKKALYLNNTGFIICTIFLSIFSAIVLVTTIYLGIFKKKIINWIKENDLLDDSKLIEKQINIETQKEQINLEDFLVVVKINKVFSISNNVSKSFWNRNLNNSVSKKITVYFFLTFDFEKVTFGKYKDVTIDSFRDSAIRNNFINETN
ncbi:Uncharacterised protein [Mycoplasmopsis maculosa]|uniref:Uncharacterized protein n=1 Tax=Mycoplasmopsis maculosa TaxID=114885 RepID=A0A449B4E1_9BACT|nr:hypothetical protein [Mycoplasmopsis maculosa]VEU75471.1 Uncharacterised protein [Mycoplasmopsis maculosa]